MWKKIKDQTRQTEKWTPKGTEKKLRDQSKIFKNAFISIWEEDLGRHCIHRKSSGFNKKGQ